MLTRIQKRLQKTISNINNISNITMVSRNYRPRRLRIYTTAFLYLKALTRTYEMIGLVTVNKKQFSLAQSAPVPEPSF